MPKGARKRSESGYYHVVPKGISDQLIFLGDADRSLYLDLLAQALDESGVRVHAYCLMSNHTHLVVEDPDGHLSQMMKYVHERYATFFARRTGRSGGIFRKPFWSEPIECDEYLLSAVRYTHNNPVAAGICDAFSYKWSSAQDYLGRQGGLTSTAMVLDMTDGQEGFREFSTQELSTALPFPGSKLTGHLRDDEMMRIAEEILGKGNVELARKDVPTRRDSVATLYGRGFSVAQISRATGLGRQTCRTLLLSQ